jgi:alpha-D-ribose 1-methylphosphonate 5-triphosphate synthase subunit PhnH
MTLLPGFADPVFGAQATFRAVLDAMARPGRVMPAGADLAPPPPLMPSTAALLLTLADADTNLFLAPECDAARDWIAFHCGAPFVAEPRAARFIVATALPDLSVFDAGSDEAPEESATVIVQVNARFSLSSLQGGEGQGEEGRATTLSRVAPPSPNPLPPKQGEREARKGQHLRLSGPGLRTPTVLHVDGLPENFAEIWSRNHALFPRGVDLILCAGDALVALPRSVAVT